MAALPIINRNSKIYKTLKMSKNDYAYINEKVARGQVRIFNLSKIILHKIQMVTNCKMLSNHFSNNISYKGRTLIESFLMPFTMGYLY
jgi:hypothetical protein